VVSNMRKWHSRRDNRKIHRWGAIIVALPFLIVIISGLLLQVKKEVEWVQPPTMEVEIDTLSLSFEDILRISSTVPEAEIINWEGINRLDVRPDKGIVKVRSENHWELQINLQTGEIVHSTLRRSDVIEQLHDGSWFHESAKLWIFLPAGIMVLILWVTGIYLFFVPVFAKKTRAK
jgi:uncharacterized iron-regulated membrane protein